jgi:hypothetical protein
VVFFYYILELFRQCGIFLLHFRIVPTEWYFRIVPTVWYFFCFSFRFWRCSYSVVFFYYILEMFRQCGIFLLYFRDVPTVWYFSITFWRCSDSVVFFYYILEMFRQCGIFFVFHFIQLSLFSLRNVNW